MNNDIYDIQELKINELYMLFNSWDKDHIDYYYLVELQMQPNGTKVLYCDDERTFFDLDKIYPYQLEQYPKRTFVLT